MDLTYDQLVARYGEENARYLFDELCDQTKHYRQITYIDMGLDPDSGFHDQAETRARTNQWKFDAVQGDLSLLERLVFGIWPDTDFLVVPPGHQVVATYDDRIIAAEAVHE